MSSSHHHVDLLIVGSGAAGMTAAAVAAADGRRPMVVEKTETVGGTTAISGGMVWIPCATHLASGDAPGSVEAAGRYLDAVVDTDDDRDMRRRFLEAGPQAVDYLARHTSVALKPVAFYPDYYPELEGFSTGRRVLEPVPFDGALLGWSFEALDELLPLADACGVRLLMENMPFAFLPDADGMMAAIERYGADQIGVVYDVANAHFTGEDLTAGFARVASRLHTVHLSDTYRSVYRHDQVGTGDVDFAQALAAAHAVGHRRPAVLEIISRDPQRDIADSAQRLAALGSRIDAARRSTAQSIIRWAVRR